MFRKVVLTVMLGVAAVAFAGYGIFKAHHAPVVGSQSLDNETDLDKDSDLGGGLLF